MMEILQPSASVETVQCKLAGDGDDLRVTRSFLAMLRELELLGHDVLATDKNVDLFWEHIFEPSIRKQDHGIVLAVHDHECIGALFIVPELTRVQTPGRRAIAHGAWVDPSFRRRGIALQMQEMSHARMKELGYRSVLSTVLSENTAGLASCRKAGAIITGFSTVVYL